MHMQLGFERYMSISQCDSSDCGAEPAAPAALDNCVTIGGGAPLLAIGAIFRSRLLSSCTTGALGEAAGADSGSMGGEVVSRKASACGCIATGAARACTFPGGARAGATSRSAVDDGALYTATDLDRSFRYSCSPCLRAARHNSIRRLGLARRSSWRNCRRTSR